MTTIRKATQADIPGMKEVLDLIDLFPSDMLDDMVSGYLSDHETEDIWFVAEENDQILGLGYCAPEKLTDGTYNLYAIGLRPNVQGKGLGKEMMMFIEDLLRSDGQRLLIIDTSGTEAFGPTRKFYETLAYNKEATIKDYWEEGDDKVIYTKRLN